MGDVIVARVQATDKAAEGVVVIQLILLGINQADMIVNIIRHVAVCLDANYVAGFVLCRVVNHFNELLRLAGALGAHNQSNHTISLLSFIWGVLRCL